VIIISHLHKLRALLHKNEIDAFLVSKPENIRYISGFTAGNDALLVVSAENKIILTDGRYTEQVGQECPSWTYIEGRVSELDKVGKLCTPFANLGVEGHHISYKFYQELSQHIGCTIVPFFNIIEELRMIKDEKELEQLRQAARIGDQVLRDVLPIIKPGVSEREIASNIAYLLRLKGCDKESFDTIVLGGENASLPHGTPSSRVIKNKDMITMDFGGFYQGYAGDMTRTVVAGEATSKLNRIYSAVLEAQRLGVSMVKAGITCAEVDRAIRMCLQDHGLSQYFIHGTGHGVGLEIHEPPTVSSRSDEVLQENMVITIEPGVYIPGWGGIRIEDTVIVGESGCEIITQSEKELVIL